MNIQLCIIFSGILGFSLSAYVHGQTSRKSLEHKAMLLLDVLFVASTSYGIASLFFGLDMILPRWFLLLILIPLNLYVGIIAVHYRNDRIDNIARIHRQKEEKKCQKPLKAQ